MELVFDLMRLRQVGTLLGGALDPDRKQFLVYMRTPDGSSGALDPWYIEACPECNLPRTCFPWPRWPKMPAEEYALKIGWHPATARKAAWALDEDGNWILLDSGGHYVYPPRNHDLESI